MTKIVKPVSEKEKGWKLPPKVYSEQELKEFGLWLEPYKTKQAILPNGKVVDGYDWKKVYFDLGATNDKGDVFVHNLTYRMNDQNEWHPYSCDVPQEELENKIHQWKMMKGKEEWIENRKIHELEIMANQIGQIS